MKKRIVTRVYRRPNGSTKTAWIVKWKTPLGWVRTKSFATEAEARHWDPATAPLKQPNPPPPGKIRRRLFARKHTSTATLWIARWQDRAGARHERGFGIKGDAETWLAQIAADSGLGMGKRLQNAIKAARRVRYQPSRLEREPDSPAMVAALAKMSQEIATLKGSLAALARMSQELASLRGSLAIADQRTCLRKLDGAVAELDILLRNSVLRRITNLERAS